MTDPKTDQTRTVRNHYAKIATGGGGCAPSCCAPATTGSSEVLGYRAEDHVGVPDGADLGLGCGNPTAIASLRPGETVLDLGAGGGFDCFIAAHRVGPGGRVIGVDMTPEMVTRARANARKVSSSNVEFRLGEIEHLPVADASIDVVLSNCVINLSPDKPAVYAEAFRALRPGGRLAISDVVAIAPIPDALRADPDALTGCIAGAATIEELRAVLTAAGFVDIGIEVAQRSADIVGTWSPGIEQFVGSAVITARKPGTDAACCGPTCCA
jgi:SAM-dependent methyltransferase